MYQSLDIEVDGGVGPATIDMAAKVSILITLFYFYKILVLFVTQNTISTDLH